MGDQNELRDLVEVVKRHRKLVYNVFGIAILGALLFNIFTTPVYESNVRVRVKSWGSSEATRTTFPEELSRQQVFTYAEIVKSRSVVEETINRLDMPAGDKPTYEKMAKRIRLQPVRESEILNIYAQASTPEEAQKIATNLLVVFTERITEMVRAEGKDARLFIGERLAEAKRNLDKVEQEMVDYKKSKQTIAVSDQTRYFIDRQSALKKMSVENQLGVDSARSRLASINSQIARQNPGFVADSTLIQQYKSKLADQEGELVSLKSGYTASHPKVIALQASIDETKAKLNAEIKKVINSEAPSSNPVFQNMLQNKLQAEAEVAVGEAQRAAILRAEASSDGELKTLPDKEQGLARLMRDYIVAEEAYTTLAKRYDQSRIDEVMQPTNVQVVDVASLPDQAVRPRVLLNFAIAALLGLLGGLMAAFLAEYFFKTVDTTEDVRRYFGNNVIGSIPRPLNPVKERSSVWKTLKPARAGS